MLLVENEERGADGEERDAARHDHGGERPHRPAGLFGVFGREGALHHDLIFRIRNQVDDGEHDEGPDRGSEQIEAPVEGVHLGVLIGDPDEFRQAAVDARDHVADREKCAAEHDEDLEHVGPNDRLHAAKQRVGDGDDAHQHDAQNDIESGDRGQGERREKQHGAHAAAELDQNVECAGEDADRRMEAHLKV